MRSVNVSVGVFGVWFFLVGVCFVGVGVSFVVLILLVGGLFVRVFSLNQGAAEGEIERIDLVFVEERSEIVEVFRIVVRILFVVRRWPFFFLLEVAATIVIVLLSLSFYAVGELFEMLLE